MGSSGIDLAGIIGDHVHAVRARMNARQLMHVRQSMYDRQARVLGGGDE
jgi:hypothetical protein